MVALAWPSLIEEYPDPAALAAAKPSDLFLKLKSLGFGHQRSQVLLDLATTIKEARTLSSQPSELMVLPHVGLYTAHAVACFGFGKRVPVVDLNVVRVISRIAGIEPVKDIRRGASLIWQLAWALLPEKQVPEHNYGLLDFAATICKSRSPKHGECSIATWCAYARCGAPGHSCEVMINE
jgi:A/G-specific adenine glycosylase